MDLLNDLKNGDEDAFKQVFNLFKEKVFNYFLKKTLSKADAEDLLQTTFLRLWKYRASLNEKYLLDQHLFNIARTVFIDYIRTQNKLNNINKIVSRNIAVTENMPSDNLLDKEKLDYILSKMPSVRRKIFIMNKIDGFTYKEIADELSLNIKSVDNHIARAIKQIRKLMSMFSFF